MPYNSTKSISSVANTKPVLEQDESNEIRYHYHRYINNKSSILLTTKICIMSLPKLHVRSLQDAIA